MICSQCGKEFSDEKSNCPYCFEPAKKEKKKFVVRLSGEEDFENGASVFSDERRKEYSESFTEHENSTYPETAVSGGKPVEEERETPVFPERETAEAEEKTDTDVFLADNGTESKSTDGAGNQPETGVDDTDSIAGTTTADKPGNYAKIEKNHAVRTKGRRESKESARAFLTIKLMIAFCVLLTVSLTAFGAATSFFKNSAGVDKTVALSGLSKEAVSSFEEIAPAFSAFFDSGYDKTVSNFDSVVPYLAPDNDSGILAHLFTKQNTAQTQPDPLERFSDGENFSYVSVDSKYVHKAAVLLGLTVTDDVNTRGCYCYDGKYYFAPTKEDGGTDKTQLKVTDSKMTQEGKYYIECALYPQTAQKDEKGNFSVEPLSNVYFIAECEKAEDSYDWVVNKISTTPLFDQTGAAIVDEITDGLPFEMKTRVFKATTSDGQLYARYIVEYPYFTTQGLTQTTVNTLYKEMLTSYYKKAKYADNYYKKYAASGADLSALPLTVHVVSTVTFNEKGYLSLLERTTEDYTTVMKKVRENNGDSSQTAAAENENAAAMPVTRYEGYTFEVETGDFVQKDDVLGKDYQTVQKLLFDAYTAEKKAGDAFREETEDTDGIGQAIYSCPWILLPKGVGFCYQGDNSGFETVVLEYGKLETDIFSNN